MDKKNKKNTKNVKVQGASGEDRVRFLSAVVEQLSEGVAVAGMDSKMIFVNKAFADMCGYDAGFLIGKHLSIFHNAAQMKTVKKANKKLKETGSFSGEIWHTRKDGTVFPTFMRNSLLKDQEGNAIGMIGTIIDITEQKISEEALKDQHKQFASMFDAMDEVVYVADPDTYELLYMNSQAVQNWGNGIGKKCYKTLQKLNKPCPFCSNDHIFGDNVGKTYIWEWQNKVNNRWYKCIDRAIRWPAGRIVRFELAIDNTDQVTAKEELKKAKEKAEQSSEAKTAFLMNVSHDIRTPMNAINGFNSLLMDTDLDNKQRRYCELIGKQGDSLIQMIEDIMDITAVERGNIRFRKRPFNLHELLYDIKEICDVQAADKGLDLICDIAEDVPERFIGDPLRIKQVLQNLCDNAVKYTARGSITCTVFSEKSKVSDEIYNISFSMKDTGIGIQEKDLPDIFEPFLRFHQAGDTGGYGGVGMGLHIVQTIIKGMGGSISVKSRVGKGTTVSFTIPMKKYEGNGILKEENADICSRDEDISGINILIAEDNEDSRELLGFALEGSGCNAAFVVNGEEAVKTSEEKKYDIIFLDLRMPGMDGFETAVAMRKSSAKNIPIVALTAHAVRGIKEQCKEAGMNDCITKPVDIKSLKYVIKKYVKCYRKGDKV